MNSGFFITGTDTDVGKTQVTIALMRKFRRQGMVVVGMKPVAAGCQWRDGRLKNADAELIQQNAGLELAYQQVNPYAFALPVSPHLACGDTRVDLTTILAASRHLQNQADIVLVEGAGGWLSPLSRELDNAELAWALDLPVILVVAMRLGCINQARLSYQAISLAGVACAGWVAVEIESGRLDLQANLDYLQTRLDTPFLGLMPYQTAADYDALSSCFLF